MKKSLYIEIHIKRTYTYAKIKKKSSAEKHATSGGYFFIFLKINGCSDQTDLIFGFSTSKYKAPDESWPSFLNLWSGHNHSTEHFFFVGQCYLSTNAVSPSMLDIFC